MPPISSSGITKRLERFVPDENGFNGTALGSMVECQVYLMEVVTQLVMANNRYSIRTLHNEFGHEIFIRSERDEYIGSVLIGIDIYGDQGQDEGTPPKPEAP